MQYVCNVYIYKRFYTAKFFMIGPAQNQQVDTKVAYQQGHTHNKKDRQQKQDKHGRPQPTDRRIHEHTSTRRDVPREEVIKAMR